MLTLCCERTLPFPEWEISEERDTDTQRCDARVAFRPGIIDSAQVSASRTISRDDASRRYCVPFRARRETRRGYLTNETGVSRYLGGYTSILSDLVIIVEVEARENTGSFVAFGSWPHYSSSAIVGEFPGSGIRFVRLSCLKTGGSGRRVSEGEETPERSYSGVITQPMPG